MYRSQVWLAEHYGYTPQTVCKYVREMRDSGIYKGCIVGSYKATRIHEGAFRHYVDWRSVVQDNPANAPQFVAD